MPRIFWTKKKHCRQDNSEHTLSLSLTVTPDTKRDTRKDRERKRTDARSGAQHACTRHFHHSLSDASIFSFLPDSAPAIHSPTAPCAHSPSPKMFPAGCRPRLGMTLDALAAAVVVAAVLLATATAAAAPAAGGRGRPRPGAGPAAAVLPRRYP